MFTHGMDAGRVAGAAASRRRGGGDAYPPSSRTVLGLKIAGALAVTALGLAPATAQETVTVFAAASLKNALDDVSTACAPSVGEAAIISYAASSALAKQIEQGAPADIFISADLDWMTYLSGKGLTRKETEAQLLGNRIVLVAPADSAMKTAIAPNFDLAGLLGDGRLAMANIDAVPAGKYGKAALEQLGVWASVGGQVAQAENVRAALALVSTGEAPLGIVYQTDAAAEPKVRIIGEFPADSHPPIIYPVAQLAASTNDEAGAFLNCLQGARAKKLFEAQGFIVLSPPASN
jgi:molybdate transport system substrate-binding protein